MVEGRARILRVFGTTKLALTFTVLVPGPSMPDGLRRVKLERFYSGRLVDRRFKAGRSSDYAREWMLVTGRRPARHDRMSPTFLSGKLLVVVVRTVVRDGRQRELPEQARYSVVDHIVKAITR